MQLVKFSRSKITANSVSLQTAIVPFTNEGKKYYPIIGSVFAQGNKYSCIQNNNIIVRTLQLSNGFGDTIVQLVRVNEFCDILFKNKINLTSYNYVMLWQGFIYIPSGVGLFCSVDINNTNNNSNVGVDVYASAIIQNDTNTTI